MLHEELVNEAWLKEKLDARTGADTTVEADADKLPGNDNAGCKQNCGC